MDKKSQWYTDGNGNHYFVEDGQSPKEGWEVSKRRKMISGGKYMTSEDGNDYREVSKDEYDNYESDETSFDENNDDDFGFDEEDEDKEYNEEMAKAQEENAAMSEGENEESDKVPDESGGRVEDEVERELKKDGYSDEEIADIMKDRPTLDFYAKHYRKMKRISESSEGPHRMADIAVGEK